MLLKDEPADKQYPGDYEEPSAPAVLDLLLNRYVEALIFTRLLQRTWLLSRVPAVAFSYCYGQREETLQRTAACLQ